MDIEVRHYEVEGSSVLVPDSDRGPNFYDVNGDGVSNALDAEAGPTMKPDVNGDGAHAPNDILRTINLFNAEGEDGVAVNVRVKIFARPANYPFFEDDNNPASPPVRVNATQEISTIGVGQDFVVKLFVEDVRNQSERMGVFAGYYDINFSNPALASLVTTLPFVNHPQAITQPTMFLHNTVNYGNASIPRPTQTNLIDTDNNGSLDQIDVVGSFSSSPFRPLGAGEFVLVEWAMTATSAGTFTITPESTTSPTDPNDAGESPALDTLIYGQNAPVCPSSASCMGSMAFFPDSITIVRSLLQNPVRIHDVNASGTVTPSDALLIINHIARSVRNGGSSSVPVLDSDRGPNFYDVNGDGVSNALDALAVINEIARASRAGASGEGEAAPKATLLVAAPLIVSPIMATSTSVNDQPVLSEPDKPLDIADVAAETLGHSDKSIDFLVWNALEGDEDEDDWSDLDAFDAALLDLV